MFTDCSFLIASCSCFIDEIPFYTYKNIHDKPFLLTLFASIKNLFLSPLPCSVCLYSLSGNMLCISRTVFHTGALSQILDDYIEVWLPKTLIGSTESTVELTYMNYTVQQYDGSLT